MNKTLSTIATLILLFTSTPPIFAANTMVSESSEATATPTAASTQTDTATSNQSSPTVAITTYTYNRVGILSVYQRGSGTIISSDGIILANAITVIEAFDDEAYIVPPVSTYEICLTLNTSQSPSCHYTASLMAWDDTLGIALLKLNATDIFGQPLPSLPFIEPSENISPQEGENISISGYFFDEENTATRSTVTSTITSNSEEWNDMNYFYIEEFETKAIGGKYTEYTGGTALNEQGQLIGIVPTRYNWVDTILDIRSAIPWIQENVTKEPTIHEEAKEALQKIKNDLLSANNNGIYQRSEYPRFQIKSIEGWKFTDIRDGMTEILLKKTKDDITGIFGIGAMIYPFNIEKNNTYLNEMIEKITGGSFEESPSTQTTIAGYTAHKISTDIFGVHQYIVYIIPFGNTFINIYSVSPIENAEEFQNDFDTLLENFTILDIPVDEPETLDAFTSENPLFSMSRSGDFFIHFQKYYQPLEEDDDIIFRFIREDSFSNNITVAYSNMVKMSQDKTIEEIKEEIAKDYLPYNAQILIKNLITLDGLKGFIITYAQQDYTNPEIIRKTSEVMLLAGNYYYRIKYSDTEAEFDAHEEDFRQILLSFKDLRRRGKRGGYSSLSSINKTGVQYHFTQEGNLCGCIYEDITEHRFENEIRSLYSGGYLPIFTTTSFKPDKQLTRIEALRLLLNAKAKQSEKTPMTDEIESFAKNTSNAVNFSDSKNNTHITKYIRYAKSKGYVSGYANQKFRPYDGITLAETLSLLFKITETEISINDTSLEWYKPIMYEGIRQGLIPPVVIDPHQIITKGEFAYILYAAFYQSYLYYTE